MLLSICKSNVNKVTSTGILIINIYNVLERVEEKLKNNNRV